MLYDSMHVTFLKRANCRDEKQVSGCLRLMKGWECERSGCGYERNKVKVSCGNGNVLYLDCININISVMVLYHSFARCYHRRKLGEEDRRNLRITSYNCV